MKKEDIENYNSSCIDIMEGLTPVRVRPGMYINDTGKNGLHHCLIEILDNSNDESIAGWCDKIWVYINEDNSITIIDNGRGIPVDIHKKRGIASSRVIFTELHAGGKFNKSAYKVSGGLHGVGTSVVNALSEWLEYEVYRNGRVYTDSYKEGVPQITLNKDGSLPSKKLNEDKTGTKVTFLPDKKIFNNINWDDDYIANKLKEKSYLNKNVTIFYENKQTGHKETFHNEKGLEGLLEEITSNYEPITNCIKLSGYIEITEDGKAISVEYDENRNDLIGIELYFKYTNNNIEETLSYCNDINTVEGGNHVTGFKSAYTKLINNYAKNNFNIKEKLEGKDIRKGLTSIISVMHPNPQFAGQTKTKLGNDDIRPALEEMIKNEGQNFFDRNYSILETIVNNALNSYNERKKEENKKNVNQDKGAFQLSHRLANCLSKDAKKNEVYIVEGDSAGGTAKQARFKKHQAILPLKGKILNVEKSKLDKILTSEQIRSMVGTFGCGFGEDLSLQQLNFHKIIILTDADVDGAHIRTLILTFFFRYMRELIINGHVYIAMPPLYKVTYMDIPKGKKKKEKMYEYCYNDDVLMKLKSNIEEKDIIAIQRFKGLGEMNSSQLRETVFNTETRKLMRVSIEDAYRANLLTQVLMGDKAKERREIICSKAQFASVDI